MKISKEELVKLCEEVNSSDRRERRTLYFDMWRFYNGGTRPIIKNYLLAEFKDPKAVKDLLSRLVSVNIMKKIVNKLGSVYAEDPTRSAPEIDSLDSELVEEYSFVTRLNYKQKQANRYLEAFQKNLKEIIPSKGKPFVRNLPPHQYEVFNKDSVNKAQADIVVKIVKDSTDPNEQVFHVWTDESFWICNGSGVVNVLKMKELDNESGENPHKYLPYVYKTKSTDSVDPEIDDSLYRMSIALNIAMTDLFFACKYQCWSIIYTIGVTGQINFNPSSVVELQYDQNSPNSKPEIGQIKPTVDSDKAIKLIESALNFLLSSKGLSSGSVTLGSTADSVASGVSKLLDNAEVVEGKRDQQDEMLDDEYMTWEAFKNLSPSWISSAEKMKAPFNKQFSEDFYISISFKEPKVMVTEKERLETSAEKMRQMKTSWTRELQDFYPDYSMQQIEDLKKEIIDDLAKYPQIYKILLSRGSNVETQSAIQNQPDPNIQQGI